MIEVDIEQSMWEQLKEAASQSEWIPEDYTVNEWVADCAEFLRSGRGIEIDY